MGMRRFRNLGLVFYPAKLRKRARGQDDRFALNIKCPTRFSLAEIKRGTDDFSDTNVIGSGGYGKVYKAMLDGGHVVAIRRAEQGSMRWKARFTGEIELLSRFHHNNVLDVIGFCIENGERILVYDYIANGSLNDILLGKTEIQLDWRSRVQIALGSARALEYLHYNVNPRVIHRNIKSTNIFVNDCLTAKLAHFDVAQILPGGPNQVISAQIAGTQGYLDPEYLSTGQLSLKSDVYSFGVLLLELITAHPASDMSGGVLVNAVKTCLETWGLSVLEEELMDPLLSTVSLLGFERFLSLALNCVQELGSQRPSMNDVVKELEGILAATETRGVSHSSPPAAGPSNYYSDIENDRGFSHSTPPAAGPSNCDSDIEDDRGSCSEEGR